MPAAEAQIYSRDIANRYCFICTFGGLGKHYKFAVDLFVISGSKFVIRIVDKMLHKLKSAATILAVSSQMITILLKNTTLSIISILAASMYKLSLKIPPRFQPVAVIFAHL